MPGPYSPADERSYLGFGFQTVKGTGVAPTKFVPYVDAIEFAHGQSMTQVREGGDGPYVARTVKNFYGPTNRFATALRPDLTGAIFAALLGKDVVTGVADPWTHTITADPNVDWLTLERNIADDITERHVDAIISEVELDVRKRDQGPEPRLIVATQALSPGFQASATSESYEDAAPFARSEATWTVNGSANANVESARVRARWTYDDRILTDAVTRATLVKLRLDIEVELTLILASTTEEEFYRAVHYGTTAGTAASETVYAGNLTILFDKTAINRSVSVSLPNVDWTNAALTENDPQGGEATRAVFTGHAIKTAAAEAITVAVENAASAAYV